MPVNRFGSSLLALLSAGAFVSAQAQDPNLGSSSLETLTNTKILVSSVSRKQEDMDEASAAVYVITREEIARSSANNVPDLLRVVPGLQVAQITASTWAVSARGFNSAFADKLLVLIDGRTVYSEAYSGAHWDEIDMPLENIERIEVIRGPGAAVWGANAANGVINIITRPARDFIGTSTSGGFSRSDGRFLVQQGGSLGDRTQYRGFVSYMNRRGLDNADGSRAFDGESLVRSGGRLDHQGNAGRAFSLLGDVYHGTLRQQTVSSFALPSGGSHFEHDSIAGGFLEGSWLYSTPRSNTNLQAYYIDDRRSEINTEITTRTTDLDLVSHVRVSPRLDLVWGGESRYTFDRASGAAAPLTHSTYNNYLVSGFLQADIVLKPRVLTATVGTKVQDGSLAGAPIQPSIRARWVIDDRESLWVAVSRAVVAPSLQDKAIALPLNLGTYDGLPVVGDLSGNPAFKPAEILAADLGYRRHIYRGLSVDVSTYFNKSLRLPSISSGAPAIVLVPSPHIVIDELYTNGFSATSEGIESALEWRPVRSLQMHAAYTWNEAQLTQKLAGNVFLVDTYATARNTVSGTVAWRMSRVWSVDSMLYHVGNIHSYNGVAFASSTAADAPVTSIPAYTRLDLNLKRTVRGNTTLQLGGTNLLQPRHFEFGNETSFLVPHEVPRSLFVRAGWSF